MAEHILSEEEINSLESDVKTYRAETEEARDTLERVINNFESNPVVQSFYESGNFGARNRERLHELLNAMNEYYQIICNDGELVDITTKFLNEQRSRVQSGQ